MDIREIVKNKSIETDGNMLELIRDKSILPQTSKQDIIDNTIAKSIEHLVNELTNITEYTPRDLLPLSMYAHDRFILPHFSVFIKNKKHYKRKHSKEILEALEKISSMIKIGNDIDIDQLGKRYNRM